MKPIIKVIVAMIIWGSIGIFVKNLSLPSTEIVFLRAVIASIFLLIGRLILGKSKSTNNISLNYSKKSLICLILSGVILALNWLFLFEAYRYTTVANATLSYYSAPIFVVLFSPLVLNEKITLKKFISIVIAMVGLALIVGSESKSLEGNYSHYLGIGYGIFAATLYAGVILLNKSIRGFTSYDRTLVQILISALMLLPMILQRQVLNILDFKSLVIVIILGTIHTGVAYLLYFSSMDHIDAQRISVLGYIDPISAVVFGTLFLGEPLSVFHIIGGILILISTLLPQK